MYVKRIMRLFRWRSRTISQKYLIIFILTAVLFIAAGSLVYLQFERTQESMDEYVDQIEVTDQLNELSLYIQNKDLQIADYIITRNTRFVDNFEEIKEETNSLFSSITEQLKNTDHAQMVQFLAEKNNELDESYDELLHEIEEGTSNDYLGIMRNNSYGLRIVFNEAVHELTEDINKEQSGNLASSQNNMELSVILLVIANVAAVVVGIIVLLLVSRRISKHLHNVVHVTTEMAKGNFSVRPIQYEGTDEIGQLSESVNNMRESFRTILLNVNRASTRVNESSEHLSTSAHEVQQSSEQIAVTMSELASGAESQANSTSDLLTNMNNFVDIVQASGSESEQMTTESSEVLTLTNEGSELMKHSVEQMNQIDEIVANAVEQVKGLDKQSAEISNLVLVVKDIAEQTNLLALNAAIEAARAGEYGAGFSVVADEVRDLAEQVTQSVSEITQIVNNIQAETSYVVESLNKGYEEVKDGTDQIERTGENFAYINESITNMTTRIQSISTNMKNIVKDSQHMNTLIEDVSAVSEESAANVEEAAATSEETSSVMDEIARNAEELSQLADDLNEQFEVFKL